MLQMLLMLAVAMLQKRVTGHVVLKPEGKQITLAGRISLVRGYGPPGYGEDRKHDARIRYWVIDLPKAINTPCKPERPEWAAQDCHSARRLRLIEGHDEQVTEAGLARGKRAIVTGVLHRQDTVGEMTPIYMDVAEITPLP